jgi:hypothetical protein
MSNVVYPSTVTSAGTKTLLEVGLDAYQVKDISLSEKLYFDGSSYINSISSAVTSGTETVSSANLPVAGDLYNTVYFYSDAEASRPLVGRQTDITTITTTGSNDGRKYTLAKDMSNDYWAVLVYKSSSAGKLKIRETGTKERVYTLPSSSGSWTRGIFNMRVDGVAGATSDPDWSAITVREITLDSAGSINIAMFYICNNYLQIIGNLLKVRHLCISELTMERTLDTADLLCKQQAVQSTGTTKSFTINVGTKQQDITVEGLALGNIIKKESVYMVDTINDTNVGNKPISAGALTLSASLNIDTVYIGSQQYVAVNSASNVPSKCYHYNSSTGVFTFNTEENGKVPTIKINNLVSLPTVGDENLELGYVGTFRLQKLVNDTRNMIYISKKAQIMYNSQDMNEDFDQSNFSYKIYRDPNGRYMSKSLQ